MTTLMGVIGFVTGIAGFLAIVFFTAMLAVPYVMMTWFDGDQKILKNQPRPLSGRNPFDDEEPAIPIFPA